MIIKLSKLRSQLGNSSTNNQARIISFTLMTYRFVFIFLFKESRLEARKGQWLRHYFMTTKMTEMSNH